MRARLWASELDSEISDVDRSILSDRRRPFGQIQPLPVLRIIFAPVGSPPCFPDSSVCSVPSVMVPWCSLWIGFWILVQTEILGCTKPLQRMKSSLLTPGVYPPCSADRFCSTSDARYVDRSGHWHFIWSCIACLVFNSWVGDFECSCMH